MFPPLGASVQGVGVGGAVAAVAVVTAVSVEVEEVVVLLVEVVAGAALEVAAVSVEVEEADAPWPVIGAVQSSEQSSPHPPDVMQFWSLELFPTETPVQLTLLPKTIVPLLLISTFPQVLPSEQYAPPSVQEIVIDDPSGTVTAAAEELGTRRRATTAKAKIFIVLAFIS